jgi:hypothetical protein
MKMAVKDFGKALSYTSNQLLKLGVDREWVHAFWRDQTPQGQIIHEAGTYGEAPEHAEDDQFFINQVVIDVQRFVFGDEGDAAMDLPEQPATEKEMDGKLGPMTFTRMTTWLDFVNDGIEEEILLDRVPEMTSSDHIIWAGKQVPVPGVQIVSLEEENGLDLIAGSKKKWGKKEKGFSSWASKARTKDILTLAGQHEKWARILGFVHWDAGWSSEGAYKMLLRRGLGSTCGVDRPRKSDGQVIAYQWLDPGLYYGWHGSSANPRSLFSFDMSCAVYAKYSDKYKALCGIERPLLKISSHEKIGGKVFLGMYRDQVLTMMRILKALSEFTGLPYHWPLKADGSFQGRNYKRLWKDDFHGVAEHRHLPSTTKWDCRGLFAQICALLLSVPELMAEFPEFVEAHRLHDAHWGPWLDKVKASWRWKELW